MSSVELQEMESLLVLRKFLTPLIILLPTTGELRAAPMFDIMVLFDGSGSINPSDYEDQRSTEQHLLNNLTSGPTANFSFHVDNFSDAMTVINSIVSDLNAITPPPAVPTPGAMVIFEMAVLTLIRRRAANTLPV
jgi:hypothetical protein